MKIGDNYIAKIKHGEEEMEGLIENYLAFLGTLQNERTDFEAEEWTTLDAAKVEDLKRNLRGLRSGFKRLDDERKEVNNYLLSFNEGMKMGGERLKGLNAQVDACLKSLLSVNQNRLREIEQKKAEEERLKKEEEERIAEEMRREAEEKERREKEEQRQKMIALAKAQKDKDEAERARLEEETREAREKVRLAEEERIRAQGQHQDSLNATFKARAAEKEEPKVKKDVVDFVKVANDGHEMVDPVVVLENRPDIMDVNQSRATEMAREILNEWKKKGKKIEGDSVMINGVKIRLVRGTRL